MRAGSRPGTALFCNLCVKLRVSLCDVQEYVSAEILVFLAFPRDGPRRFKEIPGEYDHEFRKARAHLGARAFGLRSDGAVSYSVVIFD